MHKPIMYSAIALSIATALPAWAVDCTALPTWETSAVYNGGNQVAFQGEAFKAKWWTSGKNPAENSGPWQEWESLGQCVSGGNVPPVVSVTSPLNNTQFTDGDTLSLSASASDSDGSVSDVEFFANGLSLGVVNATPYTLSWTATEGQYTISAVVTDNEGASSEQSVSVTVVPPDFGFPPSAQLTNPTSTSQIKVGDNVPLQVLASDADGPIARVDFYVDNQLVGTDNTEPFEVSWPATEGSHTFNAKATDQDDLSAWTGEVSVSVAGESVGGGCAGVPTYKAGTPYGAGDIVQNGNYKYQCDVGGWCSSSSAWAYEPKNGEYWTDAWTELGICAIGPTVTFTTPSDNATLLAGEPIVIAVDATDADGSVDGVEFFAAGQSLGVDATAPYRVNWLAQGMGEISLSAVATDNEGNTGNAGVLVNVSDQPLVASLTSPSAGTTVGLGKTVALTAEASALNGSVSKVDFIVDGLIVASDSNAPYSANWTPGAAGSFTVSALATDSNGLTAATSGVTVKVFEQSAVKHKLIGYWHNFVNGAGCPLKLSEMSEAWDIIDIAFAENDRNSDGTVHFNLYNGDIRSSCAPLDPQVFKQEMAALQAKGKVFVLSLGGAEGTITLNNDTDEAAFVSSLTEIIKEWGFDGLDIDLESGSNLLHGSQIQARLPRALKQIEVNMGGDMYLTMAPEHPYVQGGMVAYTGIWGAYIPLIDELRDTLDLLHVQLYNNGGMPNPYLAGAAPEGSVDMMVAQSKMLIEGFELANGTMFAPLRDDQVAIGLPSGPSSANSGQAPTRNILDALDCVTKGTSCGTVVPAFNYPNFGGVMTWSINWDQHDGYNFSGPVGDKLKAMNAGQ
ncbi:chitinase [Enterovibrio norvegicus FF-33]|uniref:chitinase n=1 Tax=Enterovibrio norvegicus FF-454 TaxID=1185651 RepID=A0A1E5CBQ3_9GAMM|nr:Ig-like domain-containing protein [Enterovibrio norvegicus]OEE62857.1 chitinase [Enterovibrio norvegicus FF-454]OEE66781.1 chitinase [Enterovibrio norvegicus FF-33]